MMLNLLADWADRYTETPDHQPEVTMYRFLHRLADRAYHAARALATHDSATCRI